MRYDDTYFRTSDASAIDDEFNDVVPFARAVDLHVRAKTIEQQFRNAADRRNALRQAA